MQFKFNRTFDLPNNEHVELDLEEMMNLCESMLLEFGLPKVIEVMGKHGLAPEVGDHRSIDLGPIKIELDNDTPE